MSLHSQEFGSSYTLWHGIKITRAMKELGFVSGNKGKCESNSSLLQDKDNYRENIISIEFK